MKKIAILGASGHGKVAADIALLVGWEEVLFFDDNVASKTFIEEWPVNGDTNDLLNRISEFSGVFVAIGNNRIRHEKISLLDVNSSLVTLVHPKAVISPYASVSKGVMIVGGAIVNAFCHVGTGGIINTGATVGHDCYIDDYAHVAPGANIAGNVRIGRYSWIGIGASIRQGILIGEEVTVGAGAAVIADVPDGQTVVGVPARALSRN